MTLTTEVIQSRRKVSTRGFTLIELVAVMILLAILSAIAIPKYFDHAQNAKDAADKASIAGVNTAMHLAYIDHQSRQAPSSEWITTLAQLPGVMQTGQLPTGLTVSGSQIVDQRGNTYNLTAESALQSGLLTIQGGGGGSGGGGSGGS